MEQGDKLQVKVKNFRLSLELDRRLQALADRFDTSHNGMLRTALAVGIENMERLNAPKVQATPTPPLSPAPTTRTA